MEAMRLTMVDLFSGIGGFTRAGESNGIRTVCFVERDERCRAFLARAYPDIPQHEDIKTFDGKQYAGAFLMCAGCPCQPASRAGKQRGAQDDRWLWPQAIRVLSEVRPTWALFENPPGIGDVGLAGILSDVEAQGYETRVFSIPACGVGAPHLRERYWIICRRMADSPIPGQPGPGSNRGSGGGTEGEADDAQHAAAEIHAGDIGGAWKNSVDVPCADGKLRRAPDTVVVLVDGSSVDVFDLLAQEGWPHRSILAALGNSLISEIPRRIIAAMLQSEESL